MQYNKGTWIAKGIFFGLLFVSVVTGATMLLWNQLAVSIFGLPAISFFQALGLMILGRLLTGGFRPRGGFGHKMRGRYMRERWQNLSPEQREQFMHRFRNRGCGPMSPQDKPQEDLNTTSNI